MLGNAAGRACGRGYGRTVTTLPEEQLLAWSGSSSCLFTGKREGGRVDVGGGESGCQEVREKKEVHEEEIF